MVKTERQAYITNKIIEIHNNPTIPSQLKWDAVKIEASIANGLPDEEIESLYQKLQADLVNHIIFKPLNKQ